MLKEVKFNVFLSELISESGYTKVDFYTKLGIKKAYLYDILNGRVNPPPPEKQFKIVKILNLTPEKRSEFFELAAKERNEIPADIFCYMDEEIKQKLRSSSNYKKIIDDKIEGVK